VNRQEVASLGNGHRTAARPCLQDGVRRTATAGPTFMPPGFAVVLGSVSASEPPGKLPYWCPAWAAPGAGWCGGRWALEQPAGAPHWGSIWGAFSSTFWRMQAEFPAVACVSTQSTACTQRHLKL